VSEADEAAGGAEDQNPVRAQGDQEDARGEAAYVRYTELATSKEYPTHLLRAGALFNHRAHFKVGDLVQYKPMMHLYRYPAANCPAVVVEPPGLPADLGEDSPLAPGAEQASQLLELRRSDETPYEDVFIGFLDGEYVFRVYKVASRRLEPWRQSEPDPGEPAQASAN
jgi:hypothetical protein